MSVATTSSIGAPPSATTTPLFAGSTERTEQWSAAQERDDLILRQHVPGGAGVYCTSQNNSGQARPRTARSGPSPPVDQWRPISRPTMSGRGGAERPVEGRGQQRARRAPGAHATPVRRGFPRSRGSAPPAGTTGRGKRAGRLVTNHPLKTTASSRRASTLAARRNSASTLLISGSAICAPRTGTLTCSVASWIVSLSAIAIRWLWGKSAGGGFGKGNVSRPHEVRVPGSGPCNGRKVAATRARLASS